MICSFHVDDFIASSVIAQLLFLQSDSSKKPIHMYINSPGMFGCRFLHICVPRFDQFWCLHGAFQSRWQRYGRACNLWHNADDHRSSRYMVCWPGGWWRTLVCPFEAVCDSSSGFEHGIFTSMCRRKGNAHSSSELSNNGSSAKWGSSGTLSIVLFSSLKVWRVFLRKDLLAFWEEIRIQASGERLQTSDASLNPFRSGLFALVSLLYGNVARLPLSELRHATE